LSSKFENITVVSSKEEALFAADVFSIVSERKQIFIVGGDQIYRLFERLFYRVYLTEVFAYISGGDAFFLNQFDGRRWNRVEEKSYEKSEVDEYSFNIKILERKRKNVRHRNVQEFFTDNANRLSFYSGDDVVKRAKKLRDIPDQQIQLPLGR
jgi:dihydrofolate reductase